MEPPGPRPQETPGLVKTLYPNLTGLVNLTCDGLAWPELRSTVCTAEVIFCDPRAPEGLYRGLNILLVLE